MIESLIVLIVTILVMLWIIAVGFVYYQKYTVRIATNDAAAKVSSTYHSPDTNIIMGYISH